MEQRAQTAPGGMRRRPTRDGETPRGGETPRSVTPGVGAVQESQPPGISDAQERAKLLMRRKNMTSTYTDAYTGIGAIEPVRAHTECFRNVIRPELLEHIHAWQAQEPDVNQIQKVADGCRAINSLIRRQELKNKTEYTREFTKKHGAVQARRTVQIEDQEGFIKTDLRHRNYSRVPVGSIYEMDSWEIEASKERERFEREQLLQYEKDMAELGRKTANRQHTRVNLCLYTRGDPGPTEVQRLFRLQNMRGDKWVSEYRGAYTGSRKAQ